MLTCIQFGLNTSDMSATLRLYSEAFGFQNAGGQGIWGTVIGIQGLPPESRAVMWWMVGRQPFFQLEIFQHTNPVQRPRPAGWRASDHGWARFGLYVADLDHAIATLKDWGLGLSGEGAGPDGSRRVAFFDPYIGAYVELREKQGIEAAEMIYGAASVSDLDHAREYYRDVLGFELGSIEELHRPEDEALWGLAGAKREGFLVRSGDVMLEILRYDDPVGKPRPADHRASDQCFFNAAFGSHDRSEVAEVLARIQASGTGSINILETPELLAAYVNEAERESEFSFIAPDMMEALGFKPLTPFFG